MTHRTPLRAAVGLTAAFFALAAAIPVLAGTETDDAAIETLVVTANRIPTAEGDVGSAVTTIGREAIDERQTIHAADLLRDVPGVAVSRLGGYGAQTQVRIRGAEANHVLVLVDGVKANDPAGADEYDFSALTAYDIEEIEVVRGPQSALWGSEATAGVISITTRRADAPTARGFVEGGSRDTVYTGARLGTGGRRGGLSLNGSYLDTRGQSAALAGSEDDGYRNLTVGLNGDWRPGDNRRASVAGRYTKADVEFDGTDFASGLPADANLESHNEFLTLKGEGGMTLLDDRWDNNLRVTWLDTERREFRDGTWEASTAAEKLGVYYQSTLSFEPAAQTLVLAVDYEDEAFTQRGFVGFGDPNQDQSRHGVGWVAEYLTTPLDGLDLTGSVRYDDASDFGDVTTYRATASYRIPGVPTRLRGSVGTGQKAPTFVEQFGYYPDSFVGNPSLTPERTEGFDVGLDQAFLAGRWQAGVTYFRERLENEIVTTFTDDFLATADNLNGSSDRQGIETTVSGRVGAHLSLDATYTWVNSQQPDGAREIRRPRHMASASANYRWLSGRANLNVNLSWTGNQLDTIFPPPTYAAQAVELADYVLVDVAGSYALSERLALYLRAENLFDEDYVLVTGYRAPGRSVHLGVRFGVGG